MTTRRLIALWRFGRDVLPDAKSLDFYSWLYKLDNLIDARTGISGEPFKPETWPATAREVRVSAVRRAIVGLLVQCTEQQVADLHRIHDNAPWKGLANCPEDKLDDTYELVRRTAASAMLAAAPKAEPVKPSCAGIFDHKWLDPVCVHNGCQLSAEGKPEAADQKATQTSEQDHPKGSAQVAPAALAALRKIADRAPWLENSTHGPRWRCPSCGYAWVESEQHADHCDAVIARAALAAEPVKPQEKQGETDWQNVDELMLRSVGAMAIAEGDEGWQNVPIDCPMLAAVVKLRRDFDAATQAEPVKLAQWQIETAPKDSTRIETLVADFVHDYEWDYGGVCPHIPNDGERAMLLDCVHGLLADQEFVALMAGVNAEVKPSPAKGEQ